MLTACCYLLKPYVTFIINLFVTRQFTELILNMQYELKAKERDKALLPFYPFTFLPLTVLKAKERDKVLFTFLPFYLFTFNCSQGKGKGIRFFLPFYPFTFLPLTVLKAKERDKALFTFLPFYLFTFINSLAAYPQSSAATSLPAPPGAHACIRLALPG